MGPSWNVGTDAYANVPTRPTNSSNALSEFFIWVFIALSPFAWDLLAMPLFKHAFRQTLRCFAGWHGNDRKRLNNKGITLLTISSRENFPMRIGVKTKQTC